MRPISHDIRTAQALNAGPQCRRCGGPVRLVGSEPDSADATALLTWFCSACDDYWASAAPAGESSQANLQATLNDHRRYLSQLRGRLEQTFAWIERAREETANGLDQSADGADPSASAPSWTRQPRQAGIPDPVASVYITDELAWRPRTRPDGARQSMMLKELAREMVDRPDQVLPRLVDLAMDLCGAVSGGLSLYEPDPAPGVFRWHHLRGTLACFTGATTPRNFSPCGIALDHHAPILVQRPERVYTWLRDADVSLPECLLVPLEAGDQALLGTLWIVADREGQFDAGHCEALGELAVFAGLSLKLIQDRQSLQAALAQQQTLTREMEHRVKNLFSLTDALLRMGARSGGTARDLADRMSERLRALAAANGLVRPTGTGAAPSQAADVDQILRTILAPYDRGRFEIEGPPVAVGPQAQNTCALILHELATNAAKHGALCSDDGRVSVTWTADDGRLRLHWRESGGPAIAAPPATAGFGSVLCDRTVRAMDGTLAHDWRPEGLAVTLTLPLGHVAA